MKHDKSHVEHHRHGLRIRLNAQWECVGRVSLCFAFRAFTCLDSRFGAGLKSPARQVMALRGSDGEACWLGGLSCEDSEAISQGVDDFLEGNCAVWVGQILAASRRGLSFWRARHRDALASGEPHGYRFVEGVDEARRGCCWPNPPGAGKMSVWHMGRQRCRGSRIKANGHPHAPRVELARGDGWIWNLTQ